MGLAYGFSDLKATWSRQQTESSHAEEIVADDMHFLLSGDYGLNLTVVDVAQSDSGIYFLNVTSNDLNASLSFKVRVLGEW